jgi:hypothetical protein
MGSGETSSSLRVILLAKYHYSKYYCEDTTYAIVTAAPLRRAGEVPKDRGKD